MALNFELLGDAGAPVTNYLQGQQDVVRNQLAQQQFETGRIGQETSRLTQDKMRMEMDAFKRRQAGLDQFMQKAKELGVDGDPEQLTRIFYDHALSTGDPEQVRAAGIAVQTARERKNYEAGLDPVAAAPTPSNNFVNFPNAREIAPGAAPMVPRAAGPVDLAPAAQGEVGTPVLTGNALTPTPNRLAQIDKRLLELRRFPTAGEKERADLVRERDRLMTPHIVGTNLVTLGGGVAYTAPEKTPSSVDATTMKALGYPLTPKGFAAFKDAQRQERLLTPEEEAQKTRIALASRPPGPPRAEPAPSITNIVDPTNPSQMIAIDARRYQGGGVGSPGVIGASGKEPGAAVRTNKAEAGKTQLADDLENLRASFETLDKLRAIPSTERGALSNVTSGIASTAIGQRTGQFFATEAQVERDVINSARSRLVNSIKNATGMSAQQLNSNVELQTMLKSISDPGQSYQSAIRIIEDIENAYVKNNGTLPKPGAPTPKPSGGGAPPLPPGFKRDN